MFLITNANVELERKYHIPREKLTQGLCWYYAQMLHNLIGGSEIHSYNRGDHVGVFYGGKIYTAASEFADENPADYHHRTEEDVAMDEINCTFKDPAYHQQLKAIFAEVEESTRQSSFYSNLSVESVPESNPAVMHR